MYNQSETRHSTTNKNKQNINTAANQKQNIYLVIININIAFQQNVFNDQNNVHNHNNKM